MKIEINKKTLTTIATIAGACGLAFLAWKLYENKFANPNAVATRPDADIELVASRPNTVRFVSAAAMEDLGVKTDVVRESPAPQPLRMPGTLLIDPERMVHVHSRFSGELVSVGKVSEEENARALRYGDRVQKGQLLAKVWSKEIGEKKSEFVDILSRLEISKSMLAKFESATKGIIPEQKILETRREMEADLVAATRVERTLKSWRLSDEEIENVRHEAAALRQRDRSGDDDISKKWAETEIRAAISGIIVEKNFNVGDIIDPQDDLFKIADLSRLQVMVNVYEEDLGAVRALPPEARKWKLDLKSDPGNNAIEGSFDLIGSVIDPAQRTGVLIGWLDNPNLNLAVGQFITVTVELPPDRNLVAVPESALIEEGDKSSIFVKTGPGNEFTRRDVEVVHRTSGTVMIRSVSRIGGPSERYLAGEIVAVTGVLGLGGELANLKADAAPR